MKATAVSALFQTQFPLVQGGMIWCSSWRLASAVSNAGGLGLIGSGSMYPEVLREHIQQCQAATDKPFGVNVPLLYPNIEEHMNSIAELGVKIVFTSAGNPATWTSWLKERGITVVHVVSNSKFALKAAQAGVDAIVAEGFEAGGHNGREETTTLCLIPQVREALNAGGYSSLPLIAAGGVASGGAIAACLALGANGIQIGSLFAAAEESSAHENFKKAILEADDGATQLTLKELTPVRLLKNPFWQAVQAAYARGASREELAELLGRGRAKKGMFEGDLNEGELEIGQVAAQISAVKSAGAIIEQLNQEYHQAIGRLK